MGVGWYACEICGETFSDHGDYGRCGNCEEMVCSDCEEIQGMKYGLVEEDSEEADMFGVHALKECDLCSDKVVRDSDILEFLLELCNLTEDEVIARIKVRRGIE
jgi:hypothetical protein